MFLLLFNLLVSFILNMSQEAQMSEACQSPQDDYANNAQHISHTSKLATCCQFPYASEVTKYDKLSYDWEKTLQISRAFKIPYTDWEIDSVEDDFMVPEPPSLSGIIDGTTNKSSSSKTTDKEEKYIDDDISTISNISDVKVSNASRKHTFGKERVERTGNIYDKLYNACLKGQISIINDILKQCTTTLMPDEDERTPLYAACIGDHPEVVNLLVDAGYDVNHQDVNGKTPLHIAFENHAPYLAEALRTKFYANIEIRDKQNWTPLHTAIDRGYYSYSRQLAQFLCQDVGTEVSWIQLQAACYDENTKYVKFLLDAKTNVNRNSSAGHTPLHIAVKKSNINIINLLLDQNVDIDNKTIDCKTPLHIAVENGEETIIRTLLALEADTNVKDALGNTSLHLAVKIEHETRRLVKVGASSQTPFLKPYRVCSAETVQAIIKYGTDVNAVSNRNQTALWFACLDGQESLVKILLDAGADPNITDHGKDSSLHSAIRGRCSADTVMEIIHHGADIDAVNDIGETPLLIACSTGQTESVKLLLKLKADPSIANIDGYTSLHSAVNCSTETLKEIIDHGADVNSVSKRGRTALLLGCLNGHMDSVKYLLGAGADPTIADEEGFSCLYAAIAGHCDPDTLLALIDHGAHIDAKTKDGETALLYACEKGQSESVTSLLDAGADVNFAKPDGNTSLHFAVSGRCSNEVLQKILHHGVDVNAVNRHNDTALVLACGSGQEESVKLLLDNGADPNIPNVEGYRSLHAAVLGKCTTKTLREIANKAFVDAQALNGTTALFLACAYRQQDTVTFLLEAAANPNIEGAKGDTSLHAAVFQCCSKNIIRAMIKHGADVNATGKNNQTSLMLACHRGNIDVINVLLNAGADTNIVDANDLSCIHQAVGGGCGKETVQALIDHGADVNLTDKDNNTALMIACWKRNAEAINMLLNAGANPNIVGAEGLICIHHAVLWDGSEETLQAIINHGTDINATSRDNVTALMIACWKCNVEAINVLLNAGADTNIVDANALTCIHQAVGEGCSSKTIQALIDHGADINLTDKTNTTALMIACKKRNAETINVLLNAGADPNIANTMGLISIHLAASVDCSNETIQAIIDNGADVNTRDEDSLTALMLACLKGNIEAINALMNAGANPNIVHANGLICIHFAVLGDRSKETLQALINHGIDVNATSKASNNATSNETALLLACQKGFVEAINVLLNAGADPNLADTEGESSIHHAIYGECSKETLQAIIDHGADVNAVNKDSRTAIMIACAKGNTEIMNALLNAGANPNIVDVHGLICIHHAILIGYNKQILQAIINLGTDVNATTSRYKRTALMLACGKGNVEAINVLLTAGADSNITDYEGLTWIHHAVYGGCNKESLQVMIDHGGDVNATNKKSVTALMIACLKGNVEAVNVLLKAGANPNIADVFWPNRAPLCCPWKLQQRVPAGNC